MPRNGPNDAGHGFTRPQSVVASHVTINLRDLEEHADAWVAQGFAQAAGKGSYKVDLTALGVDKLLATGSVRSKFQVKVKMASARAIEKVQEAGGSVETSGGSAGGSGGEE